MSVGRIFRETRQGSKSRSKSAVYDYEKIGRAKCYSHGAKGFYRDRNESSCNTLKNAGCVWKTDGKGAFCDLPEDNSEMMERYLKKDSSGRMATKSIAALKKKRRSKKRKPTKKRKSSKKRKTAKKRRRN